MAMKTTPGSIHRLDFASRQAQRFYRRLSGMTYLPSQYRYNLTVSHNRRFIWFRVAKVATRSIFGFLQENAQLDAVHPYFSFYPINRYRNYYKFAFVRNPWDRLVSCWHNKVIDSNYFELPEEQRKQFHDFSRFIDYVAALDLAGCDHHLRLQCRLIDLNNIDFVGRFERFNDDFSAVCDALELPPYANDQKNVTYNRKDMTEYYSDEDYNRVGELYARDVQIFGY